jgi:hypothetical protein
VLVGHALPRLICDSGRAGVGEKGMQKPPRSSRRRPRLHPRTPMSEIIAAPPVAARLQAYASPSFRGKREKTITPTSCRMSCPPVAFVMSWTPGRLPFASAPAYPNNAARTLPLWFTLKGDRLYGRCAFAITLAHRWRFSFGWCVPTRDKVG